ncbi:glycosyltransferase family 87 protein [Arthrobacter sp. C152]
MAQRSPNRISRPLPRARAHLHRVVQRVDRFITPERLRLYPLFFAVASAVGIALSTAVRISNPGAQGPFLPDYLAHWTGGSLLLEPASGNLYDPERQSAFQTESVGTEVPLSWFVSPPVVALFYAPLALLPYNVSGLLWLAISTSLLIGCLLSLRTLAPGLLARKKGAVILSVLASPVVFELLGGGQDSAFILAVWLIGIRLITSNHPVWSGAVFGLGFAKPQLVVIVPLILLATRSYRALASFATTCSLLLGLSFALVGSQGVQQWLAALSSPLYTDEVQQGQAWKMVGLPSLVQAFLPPTWGTWATPLLTFLPLPLGATILIVHIVKWSSTLAVRDVWVATLATTVTFSPHLATYDAILFVPVIMYLLERQGSAFLRVSTTFAFGLIYLTPPLHLAAASLTWPLTIFGAPWAAVPLAVIWWLSIKRLNQTHPPYPQNSVTAADSTGQTGKRLLERRRKTTAPSRTVTEGGLA